MEQVVKRIMRTLYLNYVDMKNNSTNARTRLDINLTHAINDVEVNVMTLRSDGNVGIGKTNPAYKLEVSGDINCTGNFKVNGVNLSTGVSSQWTTSGSSILYNGIVNIHAGNSSTTANNKMDTGSLTIGDIAKNYRYTGNGSWNVSNTAGLLLGCLDNTEIVIHDSGHRLTSFLSYEGGTTNRIQIGRDLGWGSISSTLIWGNVGIGKTDPSKKLQAINSTQGSISVAGSGDTRYHCYNGGGVQEWVWGQKSNTSHNWILSTLNSGNEVDRLTVATNGNVGIGKSPSYAVDVNGDINYSGTLRKNGVDVLANVVSSGTKIKVESIWTSSFQTFTIPAFGSDRYTKNAFETSGTFIDGFCSFCVTAFNSPTIYSCGNFYKTGNNILNVSQRINNGITCNSYSGASPYFGQFQITNDLGNSYYYTVNSTCICPTVV